MSALTVTIAAARDAGACLEGLIWAKAHVRAMGGNDETPVPLVDILDGPGGLEWAIWCLPIARPEADMLRIARLWVCDCAERVLPLAGDPRSAAAIEVSRRYAVGGATDDELAAAWDAAWDAARAAAWDAAWAAARAAAWDATSDAATAAAWAAERDWQSTRLRLYLTDAELPPVEQINPSVEVQS